MSTVNILIIGAFSLIATMWISSQISSIKIAQAKIDAMREIRQELQDQRQTAIDWNCRVVP